MGLNLIERQVVKHYWRNAMKTNIKRWLPLISVAWLAVGMLAHAFGATGLEIWLHNIGSVVDIAQYSPVSAADLGAAIAAIVGVCLKLKSAFDKAKAEGQPPTGTAEKLQAVRRVEEWPDPPEVDSSPSGHPMSRIAPWRLAPLALVLLPSLALAQEPAPSPSPRVELTLYGGAMQFAERGQADKRDFVYRLTLTVPAPSGITLFGRADYTRTQDGGDLTDPHTFRSVEGFVGGRKDVGAGFAVMAFGGATWDRDSKVEPTDPRLWTMAGGVRFSVPGRGYVIAAAGHHGPVGGSALMGSIVYEINDGASWFADVAIPLDASRFAARPYTVKAGVSARLKGWTF